MPETFILIPGRTSRQGTSLNEGKYTATYKEEISTLLIHPDDMARLGLSDGARVRMSTPHASVEVFCRTDKGECPPGIVFISYGDASSRLMQAETHGTGMPDSKGMDVTIERIEEKGHS